MRFITIVTILLFNLLFAGDSNQDKFNPDKVSSRDKLNKLLLVSKDYLESHPESTLVIVEEALMLSKILDDVNARIDLLLDQGYAYEKLNELDQAERSYLDALELIMDIGKIDKAAETNYILGLLAEEAEDFQKALPYYQEAINLYTVLDLPREVSNIHNFIGIIYENLNDYGKSLDHYLQALAINQEIPDSIGIANTLNNIGNIYHNLNNIDKAMPYYLESTRIEEKLGNEYGLASSYINLGNVYSSKGEYEKARQYYFESLEIGRKYSDQELVETVLNNLAVLYYELEEFKLAEEYYLESLEISEEIEDSWSWANTCNNMAELYFRLGDYSRSRYYVDQGYRVAREIDAHDLLIESYHLLARLNSKDGNYKQAYSYFNQYTELKDSLFAESIFKINSLQMSFEAEKKEKEIELLLEEQGHIRMVRNILVGVFIFFLGVSALLYYLYQTKRQEVAIRRVTQKKLEESENKFRILAENIRTAIFTFDETGSFTYSNPLAEEITGYKIEDLLDKKYFDIVHPDFKDMIKKRGEARLRGDDPVANYEFKIITKQKQEKWVEVSNGRLIINGKPMVLGTATDITERKKTEQKLQESERRYRTLQANVPVGVFRISPEGRILSVNQYMARMFRYDSLEEIEAVSASKLYCDIEDRKKMIRILNEKGYITDYDVEFLRKDGTRFWGSLNSRIVKDENNKWIYQDGIIRDITEKKRVQIVQNVIYNISAAINSTDDIHNLFEIIHKELAEILDVSNFYIALYDEKTNLITAPCYIDQYRKETPGPQKLRNGITAHVIKSKRSLYLTPDLREKLVAEGKIADADWKSKIWLGVPLRIADRVIGAMAVQSYEDENKYSREDLVLLEIISDQIALAVNKKQADEALRDSERFSRAIIDSSPLGISARDRFGTLIIANEAWKRIWRKDDDDLAVEFRPRNKLHMDERDNYLGQYREKVKAIYESGGELYIPEMKLKGSRKGSKHSWISQYFYAIMDENKQVDKVVIITEDITSRKLNEMMIKASLREKEVMLKEIYHRVKNNMQVISSLLKLQSNHVEDKRTLELFKESQNRVRSMSLIHEKLYLSANLEKVNFDNYIMSLATYLFSTYSISPHDVQLEIDAENVFLDINKAIPLGLMINELVSNALKHAFDKSGKGIIRIELSKNSKEYILKVANNGREFPEQVDFRNSKTLGLQLVNALTEQLHGRISLRKKGKTEFRISFPIILDDIEDDFTGKTD